MLLVIARLRKDSLWSLNFYSSQFFLWLLHLKCLNCSNKQQKRACEICNIAHFAICFFHFLLFCTFENEYISMKINIEDKMLLAGWKNTIGPKSLLICEIGQVFHRINTDSPTYSHTDPKQYCVSGETKYRGSLFYMVFLLRYKKQTYIGIKPLCKLT